MMQEIKRRGRRRAQLSCTECRRRKQKCTPSRAGPCENCLRRYPPVECYVKGADGEERKAPVAPSSSEGFSNEVAGVSASVSENVAPGSSTSVPYPSIPLSRILGPTQDHHEERVGNVKEEELPEIQTGIDSYPDAARTEAQAVPYHKTSSEIPINDQDELIPVYNTQIQVTLNRRTSRTPSPRPFGGILTALTSLDSLPINPTLRNAELFNFFHHFVVPNMCSVDGSDVPILFRQEILPWMIQSPLMPNIAILMASATQSSEIIIEPKKQAETFRIKSSVLALVNDFLRQDFNLVGGEALRAVIHLAITEWFWGSPLSLRAHMKGMKQMINLRGGLFALNDPVLQQVIVVTDFQLACCFEKDVFFQDPAFALAFDPPMPETYPIMFRTPMLPYPTTFKDDSLSLGLDPVAAELLDDVRFLTMSVTNVSLSQISTPKVREIAAWLHKRVEAIPPLCIDPTTTHTQIMTDTIRLTSLIYSASLSSLTPLSKAYSPTDIQRLLTNISFVPMQTWRSIPGILLWILLVACPSVKDDAQGRFLRRKMAVAGMSIGLVDFGIAISCMKGFWKVQRWVDGEWRGEVKAE